MKHCPNPSCGGREKFGIISEFTDEATVCSDCGGVLVDGPAPDAHDGLPEPEPDLQLVPVLSVTSESDLLIIESLLADAGIPYLARGQQIQDLFGIGRLVGVNPITEPVEFLVAAGDHDAARSVLADFLQPSGEEDQGSVP
ncbi:MAG: DUF2007 domain-containing protein [bacterium]|nr:DUF2007 domain-containing protein [bacterium]